MKIINRFLFGQKPMKILKEFLEEHSFQYETIEQLRKFPKHFTHIDWSAGVEAEEEYYYKIVYKRKDVEKTILSMVTVLLGVYVLKIKLFEDIGDRIISISIKDKI